MDEACAAAALPLPAASLATSAATSTVTAPSAVGVISAVNALSPSAPVKAAAVALASAMSARTKPVTGSVKVIVAVKGAVLVSGTPPIVTVGAVLSSSKVLSFAPIGTVFVSALPAVSAISWSEAKASVTVPVRPARLPPSTVTSWATDEPGTAATVSVAVMTPTSKSPSSTFATVSLKVTRQVRLSALVGDDVGLWRAIEATCGAAVSGGENVRSACGFASFQKLFRIVIDQRPETGVTVKTNSASSSAVTWGTVKAADQPSYAAAKFTTVPVFCDQAASSERPRGSR